MTPKRPYLLRAFYEWILDNNMTPHILVNANAKNVSVPKQHVKDGRIVLNISPTAIQDFMMDNDAVSFSARFGGVAFYVYCPVYSILAIYSRETQDGASFPEDEYAHLTSDTDLHEEELPEPKRPVTPVLSDVSKKTSTKKNSSDDNNDKPPPKSRPSLKVVK
ncbi:ClpXP protease specificity-enhancing factor [Thiolinea disciformis]|uniref:ClpXP protease specificity-enhancing factor n=1 Tax=Thiolinea disciformis TaxID=125614 RepID=UPI000376D78D|nr:ClpXP protease specificity-enhancing factor [Thiolinea disciformis]